MYKKMTSLIKGNMYNLLSKLANNKLKVILKRQ